MTNMNNIKIYQITAKTCKDFRNKLFVPYNADTFDFNDYELVYEYNDDSKIEIITDYLESIYTKFNFNHPKDFYGHSLSVSDIVEVNGQKHYVDLIGFYSFS